MSGYPILSPRLTKDPKTLVSVFRALTTIGELANLLELSEKFLRQIVQVRHQYTTFNLNKRSGGLRVIAVPGQDLSIVQSKLAAVLAHVYGARHVVHGFALGKSIRTNALAHHGQRFILTIDLDDFFGTIHFGRVRGFFAAAPYKLPFDLATFLAKICCHKGTLPQGAPTSPIISNLICASLDRQARELALRYGCRYSRYADDLTFSSRAPISSDLVDRDNAVLPPRWTAGPELTRLISSHNFGINARKTRLRHKGTRQEVTGIIVNERLNVPRQYIRRTRGMLHAAEHNLPDACSMEHLKSVGAKQYSEGPRDFFSILRGHIDHIGFVRGRDDRVYLNLAGRLIKRMKQLQLEVSFRPIDIGPTCELDVLQEGVWLVECSDENNAEELGQATAFALKGVGIVTANHAIIGRDNAPYDSIELSQPHTSRSKKFNARIVKQFSTADLAVLEIGDKPEPFVRFIPSPSSVKKLGARIRVAGFPNHHTGDTIHVDEATITQRRQLYGYEHCMLNGDAIVSGNSGGPVIDEKNRVCGIALRGRTARDDIFRSSFLPIEILLELLGC